MASNNPELKSSYDFIICGYDQSTQQFPIHVGKLT